MGTVQPRCAVSWLLQLLAMLLNSFWASPFLLSLVQNSLAAHSRLLIPPFFVDVTRQINMVPFSLLLTVLYFLSVFVLMVYERAHQTKPFMSPSVFHSKSFPHRYFHPALVLLCSHFKFPNSLWIPNLMLLLFSLANKRVVMRTSLWEDFLFDLEECFCVTLFCTPKQ